MINMSVYVCVCNINQDEYAACTLHAFSSPRSYQSDLAVHHILKKQRLHTHTRTHTHTPLADINTGTQCIQYSSPQAVT